MSRHAALALPALALACAAAAGGPGPASARPVATPAGAAGAAALVPGPADLPSRWDWREHGGVTPARDIGFCEATGCFAAVAAVEAMILIREGRALDLSEQQALACAAPGAGCGGDWPDRTYRFIRDAGIAKEACFPYAAAGDLPCAAHDCAPAATIAGWIDIPDDVARIKAEVLVGPVTTTMSVPYAFVGYTGNFCLGPGPSDPYPVSVLIVGWDDALCDAGGWIAKMSYGASWGADGFFTVGYGLFGVGQHAQRPLYDRGDRLTARLDGAHDGLGGGDGDSWPEPGETVLLDLAVRSGPTAPARAALRARPVVLSGPGSLPPTEYALGPVGPGTETALQPPAALAVDRFAAPGDTVRVALLFDDGGVPAGADTVALAVGAAGVLLVDDDEGEALEGWALAAAAATGHVVRVWQESRAGPPSLSELRRHRAVVWSTGVWGRLGYDNIVPLGWYLDGGGCLFLTGQDAGWYLAEVLGVEGLWFLQERLGAAYLADDSGLRAVRAAAGDPLGGGLDFTIGGPGGSGRQDYPDLIAPVGGAEAVLEYAPGAVAAVRATGRGRVLYAGFGFEAIDQAAARDTLMARALAWLAGPPPDTRPPRVTLLHPRGGERLAPGDEVPVRWRAQDDRGVLFALVERSFDGGATWPERLAALAGGDTAWAWTVGDSAGARQRLRVVAVDAAGLWGGDACGEFRVAVPPLPGTPALALPGAAPNPFRDETLLRVRLGRDTPAARVRVLDARGRLVRAFTTGPLLAGEAAIPFDGRDRRGRPLPAGTYGYVVEVPGATASGRFAVVR